MTAAPLSRPHPRHCRRRRNHRSARRNHRRPRAAGLLEEALKRAETGQRRNAAWRDRLARYRQFPELALSRSGKTTCDRLGIAPGHAYYGPVGGESPIRYLHEAAQRIARGECSVAAICGAEAQSTATKAERAGITLAMDAVRARCRRSQTRRRVPEADGGQARRIPAGHASIRYTRRRHQRIGARPRARRWRNPARFGRPIPSVAAAKSPCLAETPLHGRRNHDTDAGQPADRVALHQADGGQSDRQYGRRAS